MNSHRREYWGEFETHLTISAASGGPNALPGQDNRFADWCAERKFKCVEIVLARGQYARQPMATWFHGEPTRFSTVLERGRSIAQAARTDGFDVQRLKIEAAPSNQEVPLEDAESMRHDQNNYFEHHIKLRRRSESSSDALVMVAERSGAHLSRNARRKWEEGYEERFVTLRHYGIGRISSTQALHVLLEDLRRIDEAIIEVESEYCVYDSNTALDAGWLTLQPT